MRLCTFYLLVLISDPPFPEATFFGGFLVDKSLPAPLHFHFLKLNQISNIITAFETGSPPTTISCINFKSMTLHNAMDRSMKVTSFM
jgi:hypothetical protein